MQDFSEKLDLFARAVEQQDGTAFGALFTEDAVYHDAIYGAVHGRKAIAEMMEVDWYKDGDVWLWDMHEPVCDDQQGYVRYVASFRSINRFSEGNRIVAPGIGMFSFKDGLFDTYHEIANGTPALWDLNVRGEHLQNVVQRIADAQRASPSLADHYRGERA
ncbi:MAG: nuclear transport factor 2 family protein [Gammaproteobacteria bacterium]|nr:MAG: nuclear transport factor 2 family protein [Gammaproteobacteria bacterium]RLA49027.1 MAG: nuclear transport factor 2 family protein [Gammaproteobacteria bacterium]